MCPDRSAAKDELAARFASFFRRAAEEGLGAGACELALGLIGQLVPFELGTLWLRHGDGYRAAASTGRPIDLVEGISFSSGKGLVAWVAESGRTVMIPSESRGFRHETLRAFLAVPIRAGAETQAVIALGHTSRAFSREEHDLLTTVASLLAPVIRHGRITGRLRALALVDPVTEAFNRRYLLQRLAAEIDRAQAEASSLGVLMVVPSSPQGAPVDPGVLRRVASILRQTVRSTDVVARWDESAMAVILSGTAPEKAAHIGLRLKQELRSLITSDPAEPAITIRSASYPADGRTAGALLDACHRSRTLKEDDTDG